MDNRRARVDISRDGVGSGAGKSLFDDQFNGPTEVLRVNRPYVHDAQDRGGTTMAKVHEATEVDGTARAGARRKHPVVSARWVRDALAANRSAFEFEMRRERRRLLDSRFDAFWKEISARQA